MYVCICMYICMLVGGGGEDIPHNYLGQLGFPIFVTDSEYS